MGLVDQSVQYIQQDYAGDPRQFYYGQKRGHSVQTQSTFNHKSYMQLVEGEGGRLRDRKDVGEKEDDDARGNRSRAAAELGAGRFLYDGINQKSISELAVQGRTVQSLVMLAEAQLLL